MLSLLIYWISANLGEFQQPHFRPSGPSGFVFEGRRRLSLRNGLNSRFVRIGGAIVLLGFAVQFFFSRYDLLFGSHGPFLTGVDWTDAHVALPLQWADGRGGRARGGAGAVARRAPLGSVLLLLVS